MINVSFHQGLETVVWAGFTQVFIAVKSTDPHFPLVDVFAVDKRNHLDVQKERATTLISKLEAGELDYKVMGACFKREFIQAIFPEFEGFE
jgi:hypothetical protein